MVSTMIKQSEMYRLSGGCEPDNNCEECENFISGRSSQCILYPKRKNFRWDGKRMACKYFYKNDNPEQMTIMGVLKEKEDDRNC